MILTYHNIGDGDDNTWVSLAAFEKQMQTLKDNGYKPVTFEKYDAYNDKHVVLTFDDGRRNIFDALPILKKNKWPFYVFAVGNNIGAGDEFLSDADFAKIEKAGGIMGWHTKTHRDLTTLSDDEIKDEIANPYGWKTLAYPMWKNDQRVRDICAGGTIFAAVVTVLPIPAPAIYRWIRCLCKNIPTQNTSTIKS